jgi:hypothetical protein
MRGSVTVERLPEEQVKVILEMLGAKQEETSL